MNIQMDSSISVNGSCLQGYLEAKYERLVELFGEPNSESDGYKTDVEWAGTINNNTFTIYNWKNGKNYRGEHGLDVKNIISWNVGGYNQQVVMDLNAIIKKQI